MQRIALACSGLGQIHRGYERFFQDLYLLLKDELPLTLFKGGPEGPGVRLFRPGRDSDFLRRFGPWDERYKLEVITFGAALTLPLVAGRFSLLHFADYSLAIVGRLPKRLTKFSVLFTNGSRCPPEGYTSFDCVHVVNPQDHLRAIDYGMPEDKLFLIPHGVDIARFRPAQDEVKAETRRAYGIPLDAFVVISVGHMSEGSTKRFDWLFREGAQIEERPFLLIVGDRDPRSSVADSVMNAKRGENVRIVSLSLNHMPTIYRAADIFVSCSLKEAFGIALLEAMASGLPCIAHQDPVISWVLGDGGIALDMTEPGRLATAIEYCRDNPDVCRDVGRRARARAVEEFSWDNLRSDYLRMYRACLSSRLS